MSNDTTVDLNYIARKLDQVLAEQRNIRDDMRVLTAMVMRQDGMLAPMLEELRAIHAKLNGYDRRLEKLEMGQ